MASPTYPPDRESEFVPWAQNFKLKIAIDPTAKGITAAMATANGLKFDAFLVKWDLCQDPATKTKMAVQQKNTLKDDLIKDIRTLSQMIQKFPGTTDAMRVDLGLPVRSGASPINPPTEKPILEVRRIDGRRVFVRLRSIDSEGRSKPEGVIGASICSFVGSVPPVDINAWRNEGESTRTDFEIEFPASIPAGSQVFLTAYWKSPRLMSGPACDPVGIYLGGGLSMAA